MGFFKKIFGGADKKELVSLKKEQNVKPSNENSEIKKKIIAEKNLQKNVDPITKKEMLKIMNEEEKINKKISFEFTKEESGKKEDVKKIVKNNRSYIKTYVPGFDSLVDPGIPEGSAVIVEGGPGSGKTLFCLTLLREQCKRGAKVLYMSFEEPEDNLREHIDDFGIDSRAYEKNGGLYIKRFNALDIARSVEALLSEAKKELLIDVQPVLIPKEFKPDIIIIDSLTSISSAFSGESSRFRVYMEQLFRYLERNKITSFLIREVANPTHVGSSSSEEGGAISFLSDGIISIYNVFFKSGMRKRAIEFIKMRGVNIDRRIMEYAITGDGVVVKNNKPIKGEYTLT